MGIKRHIPNFFTALNIVSGSIAIVYAFQSDLRLAFWFICLAAFFDFIDGGVARLLHTQSEVGKELDSLCDVVSFGLAPGVILFTIMRHALNVPLPLNVSGLSFYSVLLLLSTVLIPVFSAVRLAKFNVDTRQTDSFIGLPVPANALLIASLGVIFANDEPYFVIRALLVPEVLVGIVILMSYLLISPLPMFALKFKNLKWKDNQLRFMFLILSAIFLMLWGMSSVAVIIVTYVVVSVIVRLLEK